MTQTTDTKKMKKKLVISIIAIVLGIILVLYLINLILPMIYNSMQPEETELIADYSFYEPDYEENIFDDENYMSLINAGIIEYDDGSSMRTSITQEDAYSYGQGVGLISDMLHTVINGDNEKYNSYFSEKYFKNNEPKGAFTMQKIYDAQIKYFSSKTVEENGKTYNRYVYELTYLIYENDGTYRKDIGDWKRPQYVVLTDREGKLLIDGFLYEKNK